MTEIEDSVGEKVFLCPFNHYHKSYDYRKHKFHIARCKDRRGKTIYPCKYFPGHIFIKVEELIQHEKECPHRKDLAKLEPVDSADACMDETNADDP